MSEITVHHGDSREVLKGLADASIDAVVCDPPYALVSIGKRFGKEGAAPAKAGKTGAYARASAGFMGQQWDVGDTAFDPAFWVEVLRVLKPGAHVIAFSGTRTYHRLASAIEDAGFEIRDQLGWIFGSGFPKSHDVSKGIDKAAGAVREVRGEKRAGLARKARAGGDMVGQPSFEALRRADITAPATDLARQWQGWGTALKPAWEPICLARKPLDGTVAANILQHGTGALNIDGCRVAANGSRPWREPAVPMSGGGSAVYGDFAKEGSRAVADTMVGRWPANIIHDGSDEVLAAFPVSKDGVAGSRTGTSQIAAVGLGGYEHEWGGYGGEGSAARFFYTAKADKDDRHGSSHPTVKPVDLMAWLCRLVCPPNGVILDPFAGTGTTGLAAMREGFDCILIEREAEYVADIERRLAWARGEGRVTALEKARTVDVDRAAGADLPLFGGEAA